MKVKFKQALSGPAYSYSAGDVADMEESQAIRLCEKGIAGPVKEKKNEKQTAPEPENQKLSFDDLKMKPGGHYYTPDDKYLGHGEDKAREKLKEMNGG